MIVNKKINSIVHVIKECCLCGSAEFINTRTQYRFKDVIFPLFKCAKCGLIFVNPQPGFEEIKDFYKYDYFERDYCIGAKGTSYFLEEKGIKRKADWVLNIISAYKKQGKLLEIGCAGGFFLKRAKEKGLVVKGLELSEEMAVKARRKLGLEIFAGTLETAEIKEKFDIICLLDVFEHFPDPVNSINKIRHLLNYDGLLIIDIPTTKNALPFLLSYLVMTLMNKERVIDLPPYHLFEYIPRTMNMLLERNGFRNLKEIRYNGHPNDYLYVTGSVSSRSALYLVRTLNYMIANTLGICCDRYMVLSSQVLSCP